MDLMPNIHFAKNQLIFEEGYPADSVYLVCDGAVEVFKKRNNEHVSLAKLGENSIFGEMAFISEKPRSATVMSIADTWCYCLSKESFLQKLSKTDPAIVSIFHDLSDTIREESKAAIVIDHGEVMPVEGLLDVIDKKAALNKIAPQHPKEYVLHNPQIMEKVDKMDLFMRKLYASLVNIAYK
jgi:signal-transduction protein with cAMP-binding, CBS, and nucleotidyltransferase domain